MKFTAIGSKWMLGLVLLSLSFFPHSAAATMVMPLNLQQLAQQAGHIFIGRCVDIELSVDEQHLPVSYVRFAVQSALKGSAESSLTVKQYGHLAVESADELLPFELLESESVLVAKTLRSPSPSYPIDKELLVFLYPASEWGFTAPVGLGQGIFQVYMDAFGNELVKNQFNNMTLAGLVSASTSDVPLLELNQLILWLGGITP